MSWVLLLGKGRGVGPLGVARARMSRAGDRVRRARGWGLGGPYFTAGPVAGTYSYGVLAGLSRASGISRA